MSITSRYWPAAAVTAISLCGAVGARPVQEQPPSAPAAAPVQALPYMRAAGEPGRTITANAGVLLLRVLFVKSSGSRSFVICDGGMNTLLRPSHYGAFHFIWPCRVKPEHVPPHRRKRMYMVRG